MPAPIQIKRADIVEEARELAAITGLSITDAIGRAVHAQLTTERARARGARAFRRARIEQALADLKALPAVGPGLGDAELFDAAGLPR